MSVRPTRRHVNEDNLPIFEGYGQLITSPSGSVEGAGGRLERTNVAIVKLDATICQR
jgi:hypothetical protein